MWPASWHGKPTQEISMTSATIPGLDTAPTKHQGLLAWVQEVAELTQPDRVVFADGSDEEYTRLTEHLVAAGTFTPVSYTHLRAHETRHDLVCRLLLEK